ncbi:MAG: sulfotransferase [Myxococcota bacterium]
MTDPSITLCMIVRDEAAFLPGCLESVAGLVRQIVVVDTGSTDGTPELARGLGAEVVSSPWNDDFAAARNAALPHVRGEWILVLDADERLVRGAAEAVARAVSRGGFVLGLLPLHNAARLGATDAEVVSGAARLGNASSLPRLLRHTPDLRWEGIVHENVVGWLERHGGATAYVDAPIVHLGYVPAVHEARGKADRNRRLLERLCAAEPHAPAPWSHLAAERARAGDTAGAIDAVERGWAALPVALTRGGLRPTVVPLATQRAQIQLSRGDAAGALATITTARDWSTDHPNYAWLAGSAATLQGDLERAERELRAALAGAGRAYPDEITDGVTSWRSATALGSVLLRLGRPAEALASFDAAGRAHPGALEATLGAIEALLAQGLAEDAFTRLEPLIAAPPDGGACADLWTLAALAARDLGDGPSATAFAVRASKPDTRWLEPRRRQRLGDLHSELAFRLGSPRTGPGPWGTLGALVARVPIDSPSPVSANVVADAVTALVEQGRGDDLQALFERRADALVPGIADQVRAALTGLGLDWADDAEPDFVFVGGAGRSGTTLFRAMLSAHPNLWCGPERKLVPALAEFHARWDLATGPELREAGVDQSALDAAARAWLTTFLRAGTPPGLRIAEKTPHNLLHMAWLGRLFPRARFLHVLRDGRAVAESLLRQRWIDPATGKLLPYCADPEQAGLYWATVVNTIRTQAQSVPGRYLEVRYEQLVSEPEATMHRVLAFLGEPWSDAVLAHESAAVTLSSRESSTAAVAGARTTEGLSGWRTRLTGPQLSAVVRTAGPVLLACGYERMV